MKNTNEVIAAARKIEQSTDANLQGAIIQATNNLSFEECEKILLDYAKGDEKKTNRITKKIIRAKDDPYFNINSLRHMVGTIANNAIRG